MKKYWIKRHPILTLLLIMLLPLMLRGGLNYSGFCWAEKRWLSDEEYIRAAASLVQGRGPGQEIEYSMTDNPEYAHKRAIQEKEGRVLAYEDYDPELWYALPSGGHIRKRHTINNDVGDFFKKYPNCCKIVDFAYSFHDVIVDVVSDATFYNAKQNDRITLRNVKTYIGVTNCGITHYIYDTDY